MQVKQSLGYGCDPQKYMFGMCEEFEGSLDKGADPMVTIDLIDRLGAKSMRIWMHHKRLLRRKGDTDELEWKPDVFARYRKYVEELARRGIRIVAMNHNYVFTKSFSGDPVSVPEMPLPGTQAYSDEMNMISAAYEMMAREFPEIEYWECGNEVNMNSYLAKPGFSASGVKNAEYDSEFTYTNTEKAEITADICYYSSLGVKRGNPKAYVVFPAPTPYRGYAEMCEFYEAVYRAIGSGRFPRGLPADTDPDRYFQVQCWHAYNFGGDPEVIRSGAEMVLRVMRRHGDGGKKVFITEFGYHDSDFVKTRGMTKKQADETQAAFFETDFKTFRSFENIETVFLFRLYDWHAGPGIEIDFGLFTSPSSPEGIVPKAKGLKIYHMIKGEDADESVLYRYKK